MQNGSASTPLARYVPSDWQRLNAARKLIQPVGATYITFPDSKHRPAGLSKRGTMLSISSAVSLNLRGPIGDVGFDAAGAINAARTTVPKTPVDENHGAAGGKNEIRLTRKGALMQSKTKPSPMQMATHDKFGRRIPAPDFSHVLTTGLRGQFIHCLGVSGLDSTGD